MSNVGVCQRGGQFMNNLFVENFKSIMVYIRNFPNDKDFIKGGGTGKCPINI